ncbi:MAG TPA: class I SAM-dependent methyltransferase [Candidatus Binatia bacterium]|jgi:SAM-dependent methyltransferase
MKRFSSRALFFLSCFFIGCGSNSVLWRKGEVPFIPTPSGVVDRMLELAEVKATDVVYDIGSGDGRIVIRAAKKYGASAVGIEIDGELIDRARSRASVEGVDHLVKFREEDALNADISEASVVTLYMFPDFNNKIEPKLRKLRSGARVVSHDFGIEGWTPTKTETVADTRFHTHTLYLWIVP